MPKNDCDERAYFAGHALLLAGTRLSRPPTFRPFSGKSAADCPANIRRDFRRIASGIAVVIRWAIRRKWQAMSRQLPGSVLFDARKTTGNIRPGAVRVNPAVIVCRRAARQGRSALLPFGFHLDTPPGSRSFAFRIPRPESGAWRGNALLKCELFSPKSGMGPGRAVRCGNLWLRVPRLLLSRGAAMSGRSGTPAAKRGAAIGIVASIRHL